MRICHFVFILQPLMNCNFLCSTKCDNTLAQHDNSFQHVFYIEIQCVTTPLSSTLNCIDCIPYASLIFLEQLTLFLVLHYITLWKFTTLHNITLHYITLQHHIILSCVALYYVTLNHVTFHCIILNFLW